jgi:hypothetical protein
MYLETNIADRDELGNSSLILIPWELKTMTENGRKLTIDHFLSDDKLRNYLTRSTKVSKEYFKKTSSRHMRITGQCVRVGAVVQTATQNRELILYQNNGKYSKISILHRNLTMVIYPLKDPVMTVTSTEKMDLILSLDIYSRQGCA